MTFAGITCVVSHFICGITPGGSFRLPVLTHFSLMALAWKDLRVSYSSNCCYFGSLSAWYFYIFPAFYCFPSWKTSIGGNVLCLSQDTCFVFCIHIPAGSAVPSSRTAFLPLSIPNPKTQSNTLTPSTTGE